MTKTGYDARGMAISGSDTIATSHFVTALWRFQCSAGDPVAAVDLAIGERPDFTMAHVLRAYLHLCGTEKAAVDTARQSLAVAAGLDSNSREKAHIRAASERGKSSISAA